MLTRDSVQSLTSLTDCLKKSANAKLNLTFALALCICGFRHTMSAVYLRFASMQASNSYLLLYKVTKTGGMSKN